MKAIINDGGFKSSGIPDINNCSVIALANALSFPYIVCDNLCTRAGRRRGYGFDMLSIVEYASDTLRGTVNFYRVVINNKNRPTLKQFCKANRLNRYYVGSRDHCFAVIDGVPIDDSKTCDKTKVYEAYRVHYVWR